MVSIQEQFIIKSRLWWRAYSIYFADRNLNLQWVEIFSENPEIFPEAIQIHNGLKNVSEGLIYNGLKLILKRPKFTMGWNLF